MGFLDGLLGHGSDLSPAEVHEQLAGVLTEGEIVQVAFSQRRKILRHTLGRWLGEHGFEGTFDIQRRAEEVPVAEYVALAQAVAPGRDDPGRSA